MIETAAESRSETELIDVTESEAYQILVARVGKPSPYMLRAARKEPNLTTDQTIVIGDTMETDILGGVQLGFKTILVLSGGTNHDQVDSHIYNLHMSVNAIVDLDHNDLIREFSSPVTLSRTRIPGHARSEHAIMTAAK